MAKNLEEMADRHAKALGRAEAALTYIAATADQYPEAVRSVATEALLEIERICTGKEPK